MLLLALAVRSGCQHLGWCDFNFFVYDTQRKCNPATRMANPGL